MVKQSVFLMKAELKTKVVATDFDEARAKLEAHINQNPGILKFKGKQITECNLLEAEPSSKEA